MREGFLSKLLPGDFFEIQRLSFGLPNALVVLSNKTETFIALNTRNVCCQMFLLVVECLVKL